MTALERYQCQINLPNFGLAKQLQLSNAKVLIVGMGGLGCPCAQYLVSIGIGKIDLYDDDLVSESNLHRQILYRPEDIGKLKVKVAKTMLEKQNPHVSIQAFPIRLNEKNALEIISEYDIVVEGTDNIGSKLLINDACLMLGKPLVYGAIYQMEGHVAVWNLKNSDGTFSPNYRDIFPEAQSAEIPDCKKGGVIPSLAGMVGCMQANEVIKFFTYPEDLLRSKLWTINMQDGKTRIITLPKATKTTVVALNSSCPQISYVEYLKNQQQYILIDVREKVERDEFNIGGFSLPLPQVGQELDKIAALERPIVFYCESGRRSEKAVKLFLEKFPSSSAYSLASGLVNIKKHH